MVGNDKMDNKIKYWVLYSIKKDAGKDGLSLTKLFDKKPDFVPYVSQEEMREQVDVLVKDGLLDINKKFLQQHYSLTSSGKKDLMGYIHSLNRKQYLAFMDLFPEDKIRYRLDMVENVIGGVIF